MSLLVGTAVADITPPLGGQMAGFAARRSPSERVNDPLSARAVAVSDGGAISVVVALDLIAITVDQHHACRQRAARSAGIAATDIVLSATHMAALR
jgi:neutral ceramidase